MEFTGGVLPSRSGNVDLNVTKFLVCALKSQLSYLSEAGLEPPFSRLGFPLLRNVRPNGERDEEDTSSHAPERNYF